MLIIFPNASPKAKFDCSPHSDFLMYTFTSWSPTTPYKCTGGCFPYSLNDWHPRMSTGHPGDSFCRHSLQSDSLFLFIISSSS